MTTTPARDTEPDVRQVLVHPIVWPHLEAWLATRGIELARIPVEEDDLPTYCMTLTRPDEARPNDTATHCPHGYDTNRYRCVACAAAARPDNTGA